MPTRGNAQSCQGSNKYLCIQKDGQRREAAHRFACGNVSMLSKITDQSKRIKIQNQGSGSSSRTFLDHTWSYSQLWYGIGQTRPVWLSVTRRDQTICAAPAWDTLLYHLHHCIILGAAMGQFLQDVKNGCFLSNSFLFKSRRLMWANRDMSLSWLSQIPNPINIWLEMNHKLSPFLESNATLA